MTIFEGYKTAPVGKVDHKTGEVVEHSAVLVVSRSLLAMDGLFRSPVEPPPKPVQVDDDGCVIEDEWVGGLRGNITEFSRASQSRLMRKLACWEYAGQLMIVTLTYPRAFPSSEESKDDFNRFLRRLRRDHPHLVGLWKLEYQARGAPHYHMVLQTSGAAVDLLDLRKWINSAWQGARVAGASVACAAPARTQCDFARDPDRARFYLAKEVGKTVQCSTGWREGVEVEHFGRFWGWVGKAALRFEAKTVEVDAETAWVFRRRIQEVVARALVAKSALVRDDEGTLRRHNGVKFDEIGLPTWHLTTDAEYIARNIVQGMIADGYAIPPFDLWESSEPPD